MTTLSVVRSRSSVRFPLLPLLRCGSVDARLPEAMLERMHPEDTRTLMADYLASVAAEIEPEGGTIEKFVGDAGRSRLPRD